MKFVYEIKDGENLDETIETFASVNDPLPTEAVKVVTNKDNSVSIVANEEGWKYLARICVEMAYFNQKDTNFLLHRTKKFEIADQDDEVISFEQMGSKN